MIEKRFTFEFDNYNGKLFDNDYQTFYHIEDSEKNIELLCNRLNELYKENIRLKEKYERKDRQLERVRKDIEKYTNYFMNELEWDCDRIIEEVFR